QHRAVVVDRAGSVDDFLPAVAVDISGAERVESLGGDLAVGGIRAVAAVRGIVEGVAHGRVAAVYHPALGQRLAVPVIGGHGGACVVAAGKHGRRVFAVEVGHAGQEAVHPVAGFNPGHGVVAPHEAVVAAARFVGDGLQFLAGGAVEHGQVFRAVNDETFKIAQLVPGAPRGGVDVHEVVHQFNGAGARQRVAVGDGDAEGLLQRGRPVARL